MAVAVAEAVGGIRIVLVATSEPRGYLRAGVVLEAGDVLVSGSGHAEQDIVEHCVTNGLKLVDIGATRPICPACAAFIRSTGAHVSTPLKVV